MKRFACVAAAVMLWGSGPGAEAGGMGDAAADWQRIEAMEAAPPAAEWKTRDEALAGALETMAKQEQALRAYVAAYPGDAHALDARLRLAHLLASRADLKGASSGVEDRQEAEALLDGLEHDPAMKGREADVAFARISIFMQRVDALSGVNRGELLDRARRFAKRFPNDRRVAPLLAEVAGAFEDAPATARGLLEQALPVARTPELKARIGDDLKRLGMVGKPVEMKWRSVQGVDVDLEKLRGRVVLVYFFAAWSAPSMIELDWVKRLERRVDMEANPESVQVLGICLDKDPVAVPAMLEDHGIGWPVYCDGRGWQGDLVRSLGINEIPALWVIDRNGILRSLDARDDAETLIGKAAQAGPE